MPAAHFVAESGGLQQFWGDALCSQGVLALQVKLRYSAPCQAQVQAHYARQLEKDISTVKGRSVDVQYVSGQGHVMLSLPLTLRGRHVAVQDSLLDSLFETLLAKVLCKGPGRLAVASASWLEVRYPPSDFAALSFSWRVRKLPERPGSSEFSARARARAFLLPRLGAWACLAPSALVGPVPARPFRLLNNANDAGELGGLRR